MKRRKLSEGAFVEALAKQHVTHYTREVSDIRLGDNEPRTVFARQEEVFYNELTKNPRLDIPCLQLRVMQEDLLGNMEEITDYSYYFSGAFKELPLEGHFFELLDANQIPILNAIKRFNCGAHPVLVPFEIVDSIGTHNEDIWHRRVRTGNTQTRNLELLPAMKFYSSVKNTKNPHLTKVYREYDAEVKRLMTELGLESASSALVKVVICSTGIYTRTAVNRFKQGGAMQLCLDSTKELDDSLVELVTKIGNIPGATDMRTSTVLVESAKLIHRKTVVERDPIDVDAFVAWLEANPDRCENDTIDPITGKAILSYWERIAEGEISRVYNDFIVAARDE